MIIIQDPLSCCLKPACFYRAQMQHMESWELELFSLLSESELITCLLTCGRVPSRQIQTQPVPLLENQQTLRTSKIGFGL